MRLVRFTIAVVTFGLVGCSKLTSPPGPEPIASDTPVTMASAPTVPSNHPSENPRLPINALNQPPTAPNAPQGEVKIDDLVQGKGPAVKNGDIVVVHYIGTLPDGTKFDASRDHPAQGNRPAGEPMTTQIPGRLIPGWNKGIPGMKVGGKRRLTIPPSLGYGAQGQGKIPPNSTLVFEIDLLEIKANPRQQAPRAP